MNTNKEHPVQDEEKATPEEITAIAETSLIVYIRKLKEVNANALNKIVELQQTISQLQQREKEIAEKVVGIIRKKGFRFIDINPQHFPQKWAAESLIQAIVDEVNYQFDQTKEDKQ